MNYEEDWQVKNFVWKDSLPGKTGSSVGPTISANNKQKINENKLYHLVLCRAANEGYKFPIKFNVCIHIYNKTNTAIVSLITHTH